MKIVPILVLILISIAPGIANAQCEVYINAKKDRQTRVTHIKSREMALKAVGYTLDLHIYWHHSHYQVRTKVEQEGRAVPIKEGGGYVFQFADGDEIFVPNTNEKGEDNPNKQGKITGHLAIKNTENQWVEQPVGVVQKLKEKELSAIKFQSVDGYDFAVTLGGDYISFFSKVINCVEQNR
jgi:hypothetical protein